VAARGGSYLSLGTAAFSYVVNSRCNAGDMIPIIGLGDYVLVPMRQDELNSPCGLIQGTRGRRTGLEAVYTSLGGFT
jgi:hypothetical protein